MKLFKFEMSKLWRQRKFILLLFIVLVCVSAIYLQNLPEQALIAERAQEKLDPYIKEADRKYAELKELERQGELDELQANQFEHIKEMGSAFFNWKIAIYDQDWSKIPTYEGEFLTSLQQFESFGGVFMELQGIEKEKLIEKNAWLQAHNLSYEDEAYPISAHLILKESSIILLSIGGVLVLLLFFGTTITREQEQHTWSTLRTQPISEWKLIVAKYASLFMTIIIFLVMVVGLGLAIPLIFGDHIISLQYPQIMTTGDSFTIISTTHYLLRVIVLFICAGAFFYSLILFISTYIKQSFSALMFTGFIIMIGFYTTSTNNQLQSPLNPFQFLNFSELLTKVPESTDWLYPLAALFWSLLFVLLAIFLPKKETSLFHSVENKQAFNEGNTKGNVRRLWSICTFEWRKLKRKGLLKQLHVVLLLLVVFGYFALTQQANERETIYIEHLETTVEETEIHIADMEKMKISYKEEIVSAEEAGDEYYTENMNWLLDELEKLILFFQERLVENKAHLTAHEQQDWNSFYESQLYELRFDNGEFNVDYHFTNDWWRIFGQFTMDVSIAEKEWLMENEIQPVFSGIYIPSLYSYWKDDQFTKKEAWEEINRKADNSGLYSLYLYFNNYIYFVPLILFLFLLGAGLAVERGKKPTIQFLKTQPIGEKYIYQGKVFTASITALLSSMGIFVFVILIATVLNRFGDWNYPILHYDSPSVAALSTYTGNLVFGYKVGFHFIGLGGYLVQSIGLFLCILLFFIVLATTLSLFIRNQFGVFVSVILIGIGGYYLSINKLSEMAYISPFTYLNIAKITNGEVSALMDNPYITVLTGSIVILAFTLLVYVIGYLFLGWKNKIN